jgi:hypothetical protein
MVSPFFCFCSLRADVAAAGPAARSADTPERQDKAKPAQPVAREGVNRAAFHQGDRPDEDFARPLSGAQIKPSRRIDDGGNAGRRGTHQRPPVFDGPEAGQRQMLHGLDRVSVPGVVGQVEHDVGDAPLFSTLHPEAERDGEDVLVSDVD